MLLNGTLCGVKLTKEISELFLFRSASLHEAKPQGLKKVLLGFVALKFVHEGENETSLLVGRDQEGNHNKQDLDGSSNLSKELNQSKGLSLMQLGALGQHEVEIGNNVLVEERNLLVSY